VAVSEVIRERIMMECNVDASRISLLPNFVDLRRFQPRLAPLPSSPRKALLFSNYATPGGYADVVAQACATHGLSFEVLGRGYGNPTERPEKILPEYDMVFAHGRAALEALAVGAAVICCDKQGAAPMVTTTNLDWFRRHNFGFRAQTHPITLEYLSEQISAYDSNDAAKVSAQIRDTAGLDAAVDRILDLYQECVSAWSATGSDVRAQHDESLAVADYLRQLSLSIPNPETGSPASSDVQAQLRRLTMENQRLQTDLGQLQAEMHRIQRTLTWRVRQRLFGLRLLQRLYSPIARLIRPPQSADTDPRSAYQERDV
jgi:hypothetical protein